MLMIEILTEKGFWSADTLAVSAVYTWFRMAYRVYPTQAEADSAAEALAGHGFFQRTHGDRVASSQLELFSINPRSVVDARTSAR